MKELRGLELCKECRFCPDKDVPENCYHPYNSKYSCFGFRQDGGRIWGIFKSRERRCGRQAIYFEPQTLESIKAMQKEKEERAKNILAAIDEDRKFNARIENVLRDTISHSLKEKGYDICLCHSLTFDYRNEQGEMAMVRALLKKFDIKIKKIR